MTAKMGLIQIKVSQTHLIQYISDADSYADQLPRQGGNILHGVCLIVRLSLSNFT